MRRARSSYRHGRHRSAGATPDPGSAEAVAAARARVKALVDGLMRVNLQVIVVAPPDAVRGVARDRACRACIAAGRADLMAEATEAVRDIAGRAFARGGFSGTWAATEMSASVVRADDRVAAADALEEAALAAVAEDLLDDATLQVLRSTTDRFVTMAGIPSPGALSNLTSPRGADIQGPLLVALIVTVVMGIIGALVVMPGLGLIGIAVAVLIASRLARRGTRSTDY